MVTHTIKEQKTLTINGIQAKIETETNLLEMVRKVGIELPTFCYHSELSVYGACRLCLVDVQGKGILGACSTPPEQGMIIQTNTPELQDIRKIAIELLLASGKHDCATCDRSYNCKLQQIAKQLGVKEIRFKAPVQSLPQDLSSPGISRNPNKCILCGDCVRACNEIQGIGAIDFAGRGPTTLVTPAYKKQLGQVDCVHCGQCVRVCPTGALTVKSDVDNIFQAIHDNQKKVVIQIAPACRAAIAEMLLKKDLNKKSDILDLTGKMVTALRMLGFDQVYDTAFTADLTVIEESAEFLRRKSEGGPLPLFTSCCPAWVKFAEQSFPSLLNNISTCRSPQQMFGSLAKEILPEQLNVNEKNLVVVALMPCTAKKYEANREEFKTNNKNDIDYVLTTQEFIHMIEKAGIIFDKLGHSHFDHPFGVKSGAGILFGNSGGVSEAVLRYVSKKLTGKDTEETKIHLEALRSNNSVREITATISDQTIKLCVVHGLAHAKEVVNDILANKVHYDLVEVMSCPGGCIGGAGQPTTFSDETRKERAQGLYQLDATMELRDASDNHYIEKLYQNALKDKHKTHDLLHTNYHSKKRISDGELHLCTGCGQHNNPDQEDQQSKLKVNVCVGTSCYLRGASDLLHKLIINVENSDLKDQVAVAASFCHEHCSKGPTVFLGDEIIHEAKFEKVIEQIKDKLNNKK